MSAAGRVAPPVRSQPPDDLYYRLAWRSRMVRSGTHQSRRAGSGGIFRDLTSLMAHPDPRRIDVRQTLRDPFDGVHVRRFQETSSARVALLADVSGSMAFSGNTRKWAVLTELACVLSASARRASDTFTLLACDSVVRDDLSFSATRSAAAAGEMRQRLLSVRPSRRGSAGLVAAATQLAGRRSLVFLVSDFCFDETEIAATFEALSAHDVIPIVLIDSAEASALPDWGLIQMQDIETGRRRLVAMRPSLKASWLRRSEARRSALRALAARFGREPFEITDQIDWDAFAACLMRGA